MKLERVKPFPTEDGALLHYYDVGEGRPIILLAGLQTTVHAYRYVVKQLKHQYRVIGLERRFEGETKAALEDMTMERQGKDLNEFIEFMNLEKPILVGHSLGASTIMSYLDQFGDQNISSIIFVDQTPKMLNDATWKEGVVGKSEASIASHTKRVTLPIRQIPKAKILWMFMNTVILKQKTVVSLKEKRPLIEDYVKADYRNSLLKLTKPSLFIGVEYSPQWPPEHAVICADIVEKGEYCIMKKVGHGAQLEDPVQFVHIVKKWIDQLEK